MEGRYRILRDKLWIELIASDVAVSDILMMYINKQKENKPFPLQKSFIGRILGLLKTNLDKWFKDYVNDYLTYFAIAGNKASSKFLKYDQEKTIALNKYADYVLDRINKRIERLNATAVDCRNFTITKPNGEEIRLTNGVLLGLDTIHRRSFATCKKDSQLRKVDTVVGFSNLKVYYDYKAVVSTMNVELAGLLVVSVDELITYMRVTLTKDPENFDVIFDSIQIK
ncbi:unnamed protein product [Parnassius apollo]|uniref:(apollo) hypothetical protein n=1 Tax=Parnassius apollo TaxID=110799 RepID=A0A8S3X9G4_PARAO|nr:unnamed protein product [Parnassius apollo]